MTTELEELLQASPEFQAIIEKVRRDRAIDFSKQRTALGQKIKALEARKAKELPAAVTRLENARAALERARAAVPVAQQEVGAAQAAVSALADGADREIRRHRADIRAMASPAYEELLTEVLELHERYQQGAPLFGVTWRALTPQGSGAMIKLFMALSNEIRDLQESPDVHDAAEAITAFRASFEARVHALAKAHSAAAYLAMSPSQREHYDREHAR